MILHLFFDGSYKETQKEMWWAYIIKNDKRENIQSDYGSFTSNKCSSNLSECRALLEGVKAAQVYDPCMLYIYGDSLSLINQIEKGHHISNNNRYYKEIASFLKEFKKYEIKWIPRKENWEADRMMRN